MDEENKTPETPEEDSNALKPSSAKSDNKKNSKPKKSEKKGLLYELRGEFSKIIWITKKELFKQTITVIMVSLIVGAIIFGMDTIFNYAYALLVNIKFK